MFENVPSASRPEDQAGQGRTIQAHWEELRPVNERLRSAIEPVTDSLVTSLTAGLAGTDATHRARLLRDSSRLYDFDYGAVTSLPPALFGHIGKDTIKAGDLRVPETKKEIRALADRYWDWHMYQVHEGDYAFNVGPPADILRSRMKSMKGLRYPAASWMKAARHVQTALRTGGPQFTIDLHTASRLINGAPEYDKQGIWTQATHRSCGSYVVALSTVSAPDFVVSGARECVQLPIGEYGMAASEKLARVATTLMNIAKTSPAVAATAREIVSDDETRALLERHTARTRDRLNLRYWRTYETGRHHGLLHTVSEGILSMSQVISLLSAQKMPGYDDHDALVKAILQSGVIERFTRITRAGYIGPMTLTGLQPHEPLHIRNGVPVLAPDYVDYLAEKRKAGHIDNRRQWEAYRQSPVAVEQPAVLGLVCPVSAPDSSITKLKQAFSAFYA